MGLAQSQSCPLGDKRWWFVLVDAMAPLPISETEPGSPKSEKELVWASSATHFPDAAQRTDF